MTKVVTVLMTLLGTAFAQIDRTCIDIAFNSETNTLSGKCQPRDNSGYIPSELDLNDCFGYDGSTITSEKVAVPIAHTTKTQNMSSDKNPDQDPESLSSDTETSQESQPVTLDLLPTEVLLQISGEPGKDQDTISAEEFKSLCLLSPPLSQVYLKSYYLGDNCSAFRQAVRSANIRAMDRCAQFGAVADTRWELPESDGCQCISERQHTHHRPIDELLECLYLGETPIDQCVDALEWLLERKFDMREQQDQPWYIANDYCDHVPEFLVTILSKSPDRVRTEGICQMIKMLHSHGYSLPLHMNFASFMDRCQSWEDHGTVRFITGPLDVALRSHCPPDLLELVLRDYVRRLVGFEVIYEEPSQPLMQRWAGKYRFDEPFDLQFGGGVVETADVSWWQLTNLLYTTWGLFLDLMDSSTAWAEEYPGEAADVFEKKIEILIEYQVLNQDEEGMLRGIVQAMRSMTTPTKVSSNGVVSDSDSQRCWDALYSAIIPFRPIEDYWILDSWDLIDPLIRYGFPISCHRFHVDPEYNVYKMYHDYQMQNDQSRPTLNRPWGTEGVSKREDGKWVDREWRRVFHSNDGTGLGSPGGENYPYWRLPHWTKGASFADIDKAVCDRWAELESKKRADHGA
ncbi:uncharacterized protein FSUBG_1946 [Fusarium subglutinans]|uniref:Uncharacterized protein n=1 Tax=Gibberella subglutinans TaxID=42677 RepID=A0A8H5QB02_GIBSU|nr:uncharacterized protein FSUBG_1946 [Fusarium subglutinans]KAF5611919.1 hypothetical protein FSUBG_1946 [Fusarium subglutinans]